MEDSTQENTHFVTEQSISNLSKTCPICKSDKVKPLSLDILMQFATTGIEGPFKNVTYVCNECGYMMFFAKIGFEIK